MYLHEKSNNCILVYFSKFYNHNMKHLLPKLSDMSGAKYRFPPEADNPDLENSLPRFSGLHLTE